MRISISSPIPGLGSIPGPSRPGWGPLGSYDFQFEVTGAVTIKANAAGAGNFRVSWPSGHVDILSGDNPSVVAPDATNGIVSINNEKLDTTYADEFAVVGGQTNVTKVVSWGKNPWTNLDSAFLNCTNLTDISITTLITGVSSILTSAFRSCTSLAEVNISSWDMTNAARIDQMFDACTGLEVMETGSLNLNLNAASQFWLRGTGTAVTNGCEYKMNGLNITATTFAASNMTSWFTSIKIKPSSSFANISWPSVAHAGANFSSSSITGVNSTLDCSGWTNYNSTIFPSFNSFTATEGGTSNMKIDITNLNVSTVRSFNRSFIASDVSEIVGLGGLGATDGVTNMEYAFHTTRFLKFTNNNFSSDFINSFNLGAGNFIQAFYQSGSSLALTDAGSPPNLHSLNLSSVTSLSQAFSSARFSSAPDFSNVTMSSTTTYNLASTFQSMAVNDNSNINSLFSKTFKVSSFSSTFQGSALSSIIIGNGVDFSTCTTMTRMFQSATTTDVQLPTNMDLGNMTGVNSFQYTFLAGTTLSTCQVDNFIRRLHATALSYGLVINFNNAATTETPSVVSSKVTDLEAAGWTITDNTTDATLPFTYPSYTFDSEVTQSVTPTTVPTGGVFSSTDSGVTVDASTGVVSWASTYMGLPLIRCTYTDGCYNEVQMSMLVTVDNNYSMEFSGVGEYFNAGTDVLGSSVSDMSLSVWINITSGATNKGIFTFNNVVSANNVGAFALRAVTDSRIQAYFGSSSVSRSYNIPSPGGWKHVAIVKEGATAKCFINGNEITADTSPGTIPSTLDFSGLTSFIGLYWSPSFNFDGNIDEMAVFNRALTPAQVKLIYDANSTNKSIKLSALPGGAPVAWYRMGD